MYAEEELLLLSGLQHMLFCERQWALIHLEGQWLENHFTAEGRLLHERVDQEGRESRGTVISTRAVPLRSLRLGLSGKADVVEWHRLPRGSPSAGIACELPGRKGWWRPLPVEYKRGRPKTSRMDEVQLCAQALCLEEMNELHIPAGALFYGQLRRRTEVVLDASLRQETEALAARMHALFAERRTPPGRKEAKCRNCSLWDTCRPDTFDRQTVARYLDRVVFNTGS